MGDDPGVNERQLRILDQLGAAARLRRGDAQKQFSCAAKAAKRDLAELRKRGVTQLVTKPSPGHYRLICPQNQADLRAISAS